MNGFLCSALRFLAVAELVSGRVCFAADATPGATPEADPKILEAWGGFAARNEELEGIEITDRERTSFIDGFLAGAAGRPAPFESAGIFSDVERVARARRDKIIRLKIENNEAAAWKYFGKLNHNTNMIALHEGVRCEILEPGSGAFPKPRQTVNAHYVGRVLDGTEFVQMGPLDFVLVTNREVCRGWMEALQKIKPGGRMKLYIPPPLSEEEATRRGIEPGSAMIFEIELLGVTNTSPQDLENSLLPPAPEPGPPPPSGYPDMQIMETWGWTVARQIHAEQCGLSQQERSSLAAGLTAGIQGKSQNNLAELYPRVEQFVSQRREQTRLSIRRQRFAEMEAFFRELRNNTNVVELPDGLRYEVVKPGSGPRPGPGQIVVVDYTARLLDGTVFDKSYNEPMHIQVGSVIDGWNEGIQRVGKGGRIKLYIPPTLGYGGENRSGVVAPIPADSTLIYDIELLDIQAVPDESAAPMEIRLHH